MPISARYLASGLLTASAVVIAAQDPLPRALAPAPVEITHPFVAVLSVVELPGGRLLVSDSGEAAVFLVDLQLDSVRLAARRGGGPREFLLPGGLYPLRNGRVALADPLQHRYLEFDSAGTPVGTWAAQFVAVGYSSQVPWRDAQLLDGDERVVYRVPLFDQGEVTPPDSAPLLRRNGARIDTLTWLQLPAGTLHHVNGRRLVTREFLGAADGFGVGVDGRIAIVRASPYGVEWIGADGRVARGPQYRVTPLATTEADRAELSAQTTTRRRAASGFSVRATDPRGREGAVPASSLIPEPAMASTKPAFVDGDVRVAPDGRVWVRRHAQPGATATYDVFDERGRRVDRVRLPARTWIVGFGRDCVYVVRLDEDDLSHLGRLPL
jgi:hypothetical protein